MQEKFHINSKGEPGACAATVGQCPFGGLENHFATKEAAQSAYEDSMKLELFSTEKINDYNSKSSETKTEALTVDTEKLRISDKIVSVGKSVKSIKRAKKNIYVEFEDDTKKTYPIEEVLIVERTSLTKTASKASSEQYLHTLVLRKYQTAIDNHNKVIKDFSEKLAAGQLSSFDYSRLANSTASYELWSRVKSLAITKECSIPEATRLYADHLKGRLYYEIKTGDSRSTSSFSNALEDVRNETILNFVREYSVDIDLYN